MKLGESFSSWEDFFSALDQFKDLEFHPFVKYSSRTTERANEELQKKGKASKLFPADKFHYAYCEFRCTHRGEYKTKSLGLKTSKSFKSGCKARVYASVDRETEAIEVKKLVVQHNHPTGPDIYAHYPKVRLLTKDEEQVVVALSKLNNVTTKMLKEHVNTEFGKPVRLMDIRNVKKRARIKEERTSVDAGIDLPRDDSLSDFLASVARENLYKIRVVDPNAGQAQGTGNSSRNNSSSSPAKRKAPAESNSELLTVAQNRLSSNTKNVCEEDEYDTFSRTIGHKLRHLPKNQSIHAQKLISDIMYEAELGTLSRGTLIDNRNQPQQTTSSGGS